MAMGSIGLHKRGGITLEEIIKELKANPEAPKAGAIASFIGFVRRDAVKSAGEVSHLEYEAYDEVATSKMEEIRRELMEREGIIDISIHHVIDRLKVGEDSIYVAVMGRHRRHVFPVLEEAVERVKREVPIWKKEFTDKGSYWVSYGESTTSG